jgi:hypothetical protein
MCEDIIETYVHILQYGIHSIFNRNAKIDNLWPTLYHHFSIFLTNSDASSNSSACKVFHPPTHPIIIPLRSSDEAQQLWEHLLISLVTALVRYVLPYSSTCPLEIQWQLCLLLNIGYDVEKIQTSQSEDSSPTANELLSHACLMSLFALSSFAAHESSSSQINWRISALALPILLNRCDLILTSYMQAESDGRPLPLPRGRREEVGFALRELAAVQIPPCISAILKETDKLAYYYSLESLSHKSFEGFENKLGSREHLFYLFNSLSLCISMKEHDLREVLRDCFLQITPELAVINKSYLSMPKHQ